MTSTMIYDTRIKYWGGGLSSLLKMPKPSCPKELKNFGGYPHFRKDNQCGGSGTIFFLRCTYDHDLEPIELKEFSVERQAFCFRSPFKLHPRRDESGEYLVVENKYYELFVYAENREILKQELLKEFAMLWDTYVMGDKKLTLRAKQLKEKLQKNIYPKEEATRGAQ